MTTRAASKGGRGKCTICASPDRAAIDRALIGGTSAATVAARFGVSESSVKRHRRSHTPLDSGNVRVDEPEISQPATNIDVPNEMMAQFKRSESAVRAAQKSGGHLAIQGALREHRLMLADIAHWNTEQAKLAAMNRPDEVIDILGHPQWLLARKTVMDALAHYVAARLAVADALKRLDDPNYIPRNYTEESQP